TRGVAKILPKAARVLTRGGFPHICMIGLQKIFAPILQFGGVYFVRYRPDVNQPISDAPGYIVREERLSDLNGLLEAYDLTRTAEQLQERFRRKHLCVITVDLRGRYVHCRWAMTAGSMRIPELGLDLALESGEAYMYDAYTRSGHRSQGIDPAA